MFDGRKRKNEIIDNKKRSRKGLRKGEEVKNGEKR